MSTSLNRVKLIELADHETFQEIMKLHEMGEKIIMKNNFSVTKLLSVKYYRRIVSNISHRYGESVPVFILDVEDNIGYFLESIDLNFEFILIKESLLQKERLIQRAEEKKIKLFTSLGEFEKFLGFSEG